MKIRQMTNNLNLNQHLKDANESYFQHMRHALRFFSGLAIGSGACLVHAIFPFLCVKTGSAIVSRLHHDMVTHRSQLSTPDHGTMENSQPA